MWVSSGASTGGRRDSGGGGVVVAGIGLCLALVGGWHVWDVETADTAAGWGWILFINIGLPALTSLSVLYVLRRARISSWTVARWVVGGLLALALLGAWANVESLLVGEFADVRGSIVLGSNLGLLFGAVAGINRSHARKNAELVERERTQREGIAFLNYLLRHHVLNGVTIINGYTDELRRQDVSEEHVAVIERQSDRIVTLVENVQTLVQSVSGEAEPAPVDLSDVVERAVDDARETYPDATFDLDTEPTTVLANEFVGAVVDNVLSNAVEHHQGNAYVSVSVGGGDSPVLHVADDGPGISETIKTSFGTMEGTPADIAGDGLGLYLVHTLVESYGGTVRLEDNEPTGTVVLIEFRRS